MDKKLTISFIIVWVILAIFNFIVMIISKDVVDQLPWLIIVLMMLFSDIIELKEINEK